MDGRGPTERRARGRTIAVLAGVLACLGGGLSATPAAASSPAVGAAWSAEVGSSSVRLWGEIELDPVQETQYRFDYLPESTYVENVDAGRAPFSNANQKPSSGGGHIAAGPTRATVNARITGLVPEIAYRYRLVASNGSGEAESAANRLTTQALGGGALLADGRGWEMVSPVDKGGGQVDAPGTLAGGGVFQASADGEAATFSSAVAFGPAEGAPPGAQYVSRRGAAGWSTENVTAPAVSGSYDTASGGVPYQLFSTDLARALMSNGRRCRLDGESECPVANPPLPGSGAPAGYRNYYLRDDGSGGFQALLGPAPLSLTPLSASEFELTLAGATPDLSQVVLSTCAALTVDATEAGASGGCDPEARNLYEYSGGGLSLVNVEPGAALAAPDLAISDGGGRVYFREGEKLELREGGAVRQLAEGPEVAFQTASADGSLAFYTDAGHVYRYDAATHSSLDLTPAGEALGVLGASSDGSYLYYQTASGLYLRHGAATEEVAAGPEAAAASDYPPSAATARIAQNGTLVFLSAEALTAYDNTGLSSGKAVSEVFRYDPATGGFACISCNPTGERPLAGSSIPGSTPNGTAPGSLDAYRPRALSASGERLFFQTGDALVPQDSNEAADVYEWEAAGAGSCARAGGCLSLVSSGKSSGATFVDASSDGSDAFFRTGRSLVGSDPGSYDLYDARVGGGFPEPIPPLACEGDACQSLPSPPVDPALNTLNSGAGNPPVRFYDTNRHKPRYHRLRHHHHGRHRTARHRRHGKRRRAPARHGGRTGRRGR